jgi:type II secretory pathway pseudopilin PulG
MPAKPTGNPHNGRVTQRGAILIILLVLIVVGIAAILVNSLTSTGAKNARQQNTAAALAQAKAALIGYAISYGDTHSNQVPGYLPCPDTDGDNGLQSEGVGEYSTSSCNSSPSTNQDVSVIGRLPWKTLDLSTFRDGDGECLWYAVSGTYKNNPPTGLMNWDTNGQFLAYASDGTLLTTDSNNQVVAVIFAPGAPLNTQNRTPDGSAPICGGNYTVANYLDSGTVNSVNFNNADIASGKFIQGASGGNINDQMVFITRRDIWNAVQKRSDFQSTDPNINPLIKMTRQVALCLANYGNNNSPWDNDSLPRPALMSLSDYSDNTQYADTNFIPPYAGRVPYKVYYSDQASSNNISFPYYLLQSNGANCPNPANWAAVYPWWNNWKDQLFYEVSKEFKPSGSTHQSCGYCVKINNLNVYAAVVIFAGPRLPYQTRAAKNDISQYLESINSSPFNGAQGYENYVTGTASPTFNDVLYCIDQNLNVAPC